MGLLPAVLKHSSLGFSRAEAQEMQSRGARGNDVCVGSEDGWHRGDRLRESEAGQEQQSTAHFHKRAISKRHVLSPVACSPWQALLGWRLSRQAAGSVTRVSSAQECRAAQPASCCTVSCPCPCPLHGHSLTGNSECCSQPSVPSPATGTAQLATGWSEPWPCPHPSPLLCATAGAKCCVLPIGYGENGIVEAEGRNGTNLGCGRQHRHWGCGEFQPLCPAWCLGSWGALSLESIQRLSQFAAALARQRLLACRVWAHRAVLPDRSRALHSLPSNPHSLPSPETHTQAPLQGTALISLSIVHLSQPAPAVSCSSNLSSLVQFPLPSLVTVTGGCCKLLGTHLSPKVA